MVVALLIVSGLYYSVRCQRLGVKFISYSYLNVTGIVAVTSILSLFIWAQNFQLNQAIYHNNPFHSKFFAGASYHISPESSDCMGDEFPCDAPCKSREKTL